MNKKILSFVLAMVLSVGLGSSLFAATNTGPAAQTNSGVTVEAGKQVTASSTLVDRITNVFHYESGMITSVTGADGSVTLYDRGQFRVSFGLGLNGEYSVQSLAIYGTDVNEINKAGGLDAYLKKWGVSDTQLQGGGSPEQWVETTKDQYNKHKNEKNDKGEPLYKAEKNEKGEIVYKKYEKAKDAEHVKWTGTAMNHLAGGINKSITINFNATDGASVTLNTNGKAYETYAWNNELISTNEYIVRDGVNGVITKQAEMDLVQKDGKAISTNDIKDYATNKDNYQKAWSVTTTLGGKVVSCVNDANPTQQLRSYHYGADGAVDSVRDFVNGTITLVTPTGSTTLSALDKNMDLGSMTEAEINSLVANVNLATGANIERSTGFYIAQTVVNNLNGTTNYSISRDDSGKTTTTAYIANKQVASGNGILDAGYLRDQANNQYNYVLGNGNATPVANDTVQIYWYADQLKEVAGNDAQMGKFVRSMGWDITDANRTDAYNMINDALNFSSGNSSPAVALSYADTTYKQSDINSLASKNGVSVPTIPSERFVSAATVYHHNAQSYSLNFADKDPSLSRVAYISITSIFNNDILKEYNLSPTSSITDIENAMKDIATKIEKEMKNVKADKDASANIAAISKKYFKDPNKIKLNVSTKTDTKTVDDGQYHRWGQPTHTEEVGRSTSYDYSSVKTAISELTSDVKKYLTGFAQAVRSGSVTSAQEYINQTCSKDAIVKATTTITTTTVDPVVVGVPTVADDGKTLIYGPGSRVYLQDGSGEYYTVGEGEEIYVDISSLPEEQQNEIKTAIAAGEEVMTMGDANYDPETGKMSLSINTNYGGGSATGDRLAEVEKALQNGGGDQWNGKDWIADNTAINKERLQGLERKNGTGALKDWEEGWRRLAGF